MTALSPRTSVVSLAATLGILALTIYALVVGEDIIMPLVLALLITYLVAALGRRIQRIKVAGWQPPAWLGLTGAILLVLVFLAIVGQIVAGNIRTVVDQAPDYQVRLEALFMQGIELVTRVLHLKRQPTFDSITQEIDFTSLAGTFAVGFQSIAASTIQVLAYATFLLLEFRTFDRKLQALFPDQGREMVVRNTLRSMGRKIEAYVLIKTSISLLNGVLSYIILKLFGVDFAGFWALLVFVLNFIPYIGSPLAMTFPTVLALLQFNSWITAGLVLGSLVAVQGFVENVIEPQITGKSLNLSPVVMILSLSVWGSLWGITGMIISTPMMVIIMIALAQVPKTRPLAVLMSATGDVGQGL